MRLNNAPIGIRCSNPPLRVCRPYLVAYCKRLSDLVAGGIDSAIVDADGSTPFTGEVHFGNNAAAATFGAVGTDADVVLAFDAVTSQGELKWMEDEDYFQFSDKVLFDLTATFTAAPVLPNSSNPTTASVGEITVDSDDNFLEFYGTASRVVESTKSETFVVLEPDAVQAVTDDVVLKFFPTEAYPHGVTITDIMVECSGSVSDTFLFEEWDDRAGSTQDTVESIALSTATTGEDDGVDDGAMAADSRLVINLDDSSDDIASCEFTVVYYINPGD